MYKLVVGKHGTKLKEAKEAEDNSNRGVRVRGAGRLTGLMASTSQLAEALSDVLLNGAPETGPANAGRAASDTLGPSIFTAVQEQLGLKLEAQRALVEVLAIDHAERVSAN